MESHVPFKNLEEHPPLTMAGRPKRAQARQEVKTMNNKKTLGETGGKRKSGKDMVSYLMGERIMLGGEVMTRAEAYRAIIADGLPERCAAYFAFHPQAIEL
jgi:hypothetical protein